MTDPSLAPANVPPLPREYRAAAGTSAQAITLLVLGGIMLFAMLLQIAAMLLELARSSASSTPAPTQDDSMRVGLLSASSAAGFISLISGIVLLRRPVRARVAEDGLTLEGRISRMFIPWDRIARLQRDKKQQLYAGESHFLRLLDDRGKELARVTDTFWGYPQLAADIEAFSSAARGKPTLDLDDERQRKLAKQRRSARKALVLCVLGLLIGVAMLAGGAYESYWNHRLDREGITTDAQIDKLYMRSVTGWIDISFSDASGVRHARSTTLEPADWQALRGRHAVPVRYVAAKPDWNLVQGEHDDTRLAPLLFTMGGIIAALCGAYVVMRAMGFVELTVSGGKVRFKRMGEVEEEKSSGTARLSSPKSEVPPPRQNFAAPVVAPAPVAPVVYPTPYLEAPRAPGAVPGGIKTIAILNIVFGALGLLLNAARLVFFAIFAGRVLQVGPNPVIITPEPIDMTAFAINAILAALLIVSGVGLLRLRRWGWRLALIVAAPQVLVSVALMVMGAIEYARASANLNDTTASRAAGLLGGLFCGQLVAMIYPVIVLIVLGRRGVRDVFATSNEPATNN
jgi:hypothetical protein